MRSISNKERGGSPERKPSLEEPSPGRWVYSSSVLVVCWAKMGLFIGYFGSSRGKDEFNQLVPPK